MPKLNNKEQALLDDFRDALFLATNYRGKKVRKLYSKKSKEDKEILNSVVEAWSSAQPVLEKILDDKTYLELRLFVQAYVSVVIKDGRTLYNEVNRLFNEYENTETNANGKVKKQRD